MEINREKAGVGNEEADARAVCNEGVGVHSDPFVPPFAPTTYSKFKKACPSVDLHVVLRAPI